MTQETLSAAPVSWPSSPYKGLSFYNPEDVGLFAGREYDVWQCARLLEQSSTRVVVLHGLTGCGKSSFLRAGLIPVLEDPAAGFHFLKEDREDSKAFFIRCTSQPLEAIADRIAKFISSDMTIETPLGMQKVNLKKALPTAIDHGDIAGALCASPDKLEAVLGRLTNIVPQTLTLVIDQAEEVLTLDLTEGGNEARELFFKFLALYTRSTYDLRIIIALRTEYYGRFYSRTRAAFADMLGIREYYLDDLTDDQLVAAIERPTLTTAPPGPTPARDTYRFHYEDDLARGIVKDLRDTGVAGGILPALQLVCSTLYERCKAQQPKGSDFKITLKDYEALGGPQGQVEEHLDSVLLGQARKTVSQLSLAFREVDCWKYVLHDLVRWQADGSVTTDIIREDKLADRAKEKCKVEPYSMLRYLATDDVRVLREVFVLDRESRETVRAYSLGHDTLGLVLRRWKVIRDQLVKRAKAQQRNYRWAGVVLLIAAALLYGLKYFNIGIFRNFDGLIWSAAIYGGAAIALSFAPPTLGSEEGSATAALFLRFFMLFSSRARLRELVTSPSLKRIFQANPELRDRIQKRLSR